jgi:aromatic aminotransferase
MENGLTNHDVMITMGANQAYMNIVLTLLSSIDTAVIFQPYYFNHVMALQMSLQYPEKQILIGPTRIEDGYPDLDWLQEQLQKRNDVRATLPNEPMTSSNGPIRMVTITNPCNPTGVYVNRQYIHRAVELCRQYQAWLVLDCTYEYFVTKDMTNAEASRTPVTTTSPSSSSSSYFFDGCFMDPHVIHIFSFSKSYALAGYRCGYIAISKDAIGSSISSSSNNNNNNNNNNIANHHNHHVYTQMIKAQDTIPIAPSRIAQIAALGALKAGPQWVYERFNTLEMSRKAIRQALSELELIGDSSGSTNGTDCNKVTGGTGAMYFMGQLPKGVNDVEFCRILVQDYGVAVIPGSFCGSPGYIRVCYANLPPSQCQDAALRLAAGLRSLRMDRRR